MVRFRALAAFASLCVTCGIAIAHPGGLDANGGHHDRKNGGYHTHRGGGSGGGGGGGVGGGYNVPRLAVPPPMRIIYTPPPKKTYAPRTPHEPSYAVTHGLKLHTFHTNKGKILTRGEAKSLTAGSVTIIRVNGDKVVKAFEDLAIVDRAMVSFDLHPPAPAKPEDIAPVDLFGSPQLSGVAAVAPAPIANKWLKDFRTWTSADGVFTAKAKAVAIADAKVLLRIENQTRVVPVAIKKLSDFDQQYLAELKAAAMTPTAAPSEAEIAAE